MLTGTRPTGPIWASFPRGDYVFIPNPVLMTRWNKKYLSLIYLFRATPHILRIRNLCRKSLLITNCSLNFENVSWTNCLTLREFLAHFHVSCPVYLSSVLSGWYKKCGLLMPYLEGQDDFLLTKFRILLTMLFDANESRIHFDRKSSVQSI